MKILFMGTPDFAVPSLKALIDNNHEIIGVVTKVDSTRRGSRDLEMYHRLLRNMPNPRIYLFTNLLSCQKNLK